jgi:micrococcal nuclease
LNKSRRQAFVLSRRSRALLIGVSLLGLGLLVCLDRVVVAPRRIARSDSPSHTAERDRTRYHGKAFDVVFVVDADTLDLDVPDGDGRTTRVRLLGIDAPEMHDEAGRPAYFAEEAAEFVRRQALGRRVTLYLEDDGRTRGNYGRLLAYVELPEGTMLNDELIAQGYAYADLRFRHSCYHRYSQLEASARALGKGLWAGVTRDDLPSWLQRMRPDLLAD